MRVPPQPRRSRYRYVLQALRVMQDTVTFHKVRERWHLHKVHKTSRANCCRGINGRKHGPNLERSETPIRLEDIANQPSGTVTAKKRRMPLLIASFPKGGSRSPRFNVLEKNRKFKAIVSRRKYKLKSFNGGTDRLRSPKGKKNGVKEYLVKKELLKHAHLKVNYHRKGVMNSTCVLVDSEANAQPEFLTFDRGYSIRLSDFPSLSIRQAIQA